MLCSGEDNITGSKDGKKETMAQAETPAANLPGSGMLEEVMETFDQMTWSEEMGEGIESKE